MVPRIYSQSKALKLISFLFFLFAYITSFGQAPDFNTLGTCPTSPVTVVIPSGVDTVVLTNNNIVTLLGTVAVDPDGGPITYSAIDSILTCNNGSSFSIVVTAMDDEGDTATCAVTVNTSSTNPPIAICKDTITIQLDASGVVSINTTDVDNGSVACSNMVDLYFGTSGTTVLNYTCSDLGENIVTLSVEDQSTGLTNVCNTVVVVEDNIAPTPICQNFTLMLGTDGIDTIKVTDIDNGSIDNCGIDSMYLSDSIYTCVNLGANTVTLTVLDNSGNTSTCAAVVTVIDNIAPTANCFMYDTVYLDATGNFTLATVDLDSMSFDNCANNLSLNIPTINYSCADVGNTFSVTLTASDGNNSSTCTTMVTVLDNIPPTPLNDTTVVNTSGQCEATVTFSSIATDNCSPVLVTINSASDPKMNPLTILTSGTNYFADFPVGQSIIRYTMTDASSNTTVDSFMVTVLDNEAPVITCVGNQIVQFSACETGMLVPDFRGLAAVSDNCGGENTITQFPSQFDLISMHTPLVDGATFTVTLTVTDNNANGGSDMCSFTVTLDEDDMPVPSIPGATLPVVTSSCGAVTVDAPTAMDACGNLICGNPTPSTSAIYVGGTCVSSGPNSMSFTGGTGTLGDNSPNEINCNTTNLTHTFTTTVSGIGTIGAGSATLENINIDLLHTWVGDLEVSIQSPAGTTLILSDNNGGNGDNMVSNFADGNPNITTSSPPFIGTFEAEGGTFASTFENENADGVWTLTINDVAVGDCGWLNFWEMTFSIPPPPGSIPQYEIPVGNHTIFWIYDDGFGNTTQQIQEFIITEDNIAPTITCAPLTLELDVNGMVGTSASSLAGESIVVTGGDSGIGGDTDYCVNITSAQTIYFGWDYTTADNSALSDPFGYNLNGFYTQLSDNAGGTSQSGNVVLTLNAGDVFCFKARTDDGLFGGNATTNVNFFPGYIGDFAPSNWTLFNIPTGVAGTATFTAPNATDNCAIDLSTLLVNGKSNLLFSCADIGTTNVTLTIADTSGNIGACVAPIIIVDNIAPVFDTLPADTFIQCDSILAPSSGVTATDNCGSGSVSMNFNETSSQLSNSSMCGYYNYTITRTWVATDASGNTATHAQNIAVVDVQKPEYSLPDSINVSTNQLTCDANVNNSFVNLTSAEIFDNCAAFADLNISYTASLADGTTTSGSNGNASGTYPMGTNVITFTVADPCGNTAIKTLTLIIDDSSAPIASCTTAVTIGIPQGQSSITLPANLVDNGSFDNCQPVVLGLFRLASNGVTLLPPVFDCDDADNSTLHPVVLYVYEDLGGGNLGQFSTCETSVIVQDNTNPVAVCQDITVFLDANGNATIAPADIDGGSFDNCTAAADLTYQLLTPPTYNVSNIGDNTAQLVVTDASGNNSLCSATVTVAPPVTCFNVDNGINGGGFMAGTGISEVPVTSTDFVNGLGFQFTLEIDETVGTFAGINNIDPTLASSGLLTNQINATGDTLTVSWLNTSGTPLTLNTAQLFTISVNVVGIVGSSTGINFINSPTPPEFTSQYGSTIFTNPEFPPCTTNGLVLVNNTATLTVSGNIRTWGISQTFISSIDTTTMPPDTTFTTNIIVPVQNVQNVLIEKDEDAAGFSFGATTDIDGNYIANISNVSGGVDLDLHPSKNINWLNNGDVSSSDLFFIQQHIVANIPFTSVYEYVASDVNQDGLVTTLDLVLIQDVIVNPPGSPNPSLVIANFEPWRFIPAADSLDNFPLPALPNSTPLGYTGTDIISFTDYSTPMTDVDWIAVKIGQVFGSLDPTLLVQIDPTLVSTLADERNGNDLVMKAENQKVKNGELISIPVYADDYASFISWQFTLEFDENTLAYEDVLPGAITNFGEGRLGLNAVEEGIIGAAWYGLPQSIDEKEALFTLQFRALEDADALSGLIDITSTTVKAESYLMNNSLGNVSLEFFTPESSIAIGDFELHQNRPNPFNETTLISFVLPEAGTAQLTVFDISGRVLKIVEGDFAKGYNEINIRSNDISATGVLYYKLESAKHTATKKMIILN